MPYNEMTGLDNLGLPAGEDGDGRFTDLVIFV